MDLKRFRRMGAGGGTKDWGHGQKFRKEKGHQLLERRGHRTQC